jgi:hypothetical protein
LRGHQTGAAQHLKVLGGVGHRQLRRLGELLHGALALGQQIEHRNAGAAGERPADPRDLLEELPLAFLVAHGIWFNHSIDHLNKGVFP